MSLFRKILVISLILFVQAVLFLSVHNTLSSKASSESVIPVDTTIDDNEINGNCTLREAIIAANTDTAVDLCPAGMGDDIIVLPNGVYSLTISGVSENASFTGDLDITASVIISGTSH